MEEVIIKRIEEDREKRKDILLKYFTVRRDSIHKMMQEYFTKTGGVDCCQTEVYFTYNAIISDIENNKIGGN